MPLVRPVIAATLRAIALLAASAPSAARLAAAEPAPLPWVEGSTTLVVLPDTQVYAARYPELFEAQADWIVANRESRNIAYVLHVGDIVNDNDPPQWEVARRSLARLDGVVPYALAPGNHDYGPGGNAATRDTLLNEYFPSSVYADWPTLGGLYEEGRLDNSFHRFRIGSQDWIVVALEWGPRDEVVAWADQVLSAHPDCLAIVITHAYLYFDGTRYDHAKQPQQQWNPHSYGTAQLPGGVNDGEQLWQKLVRRHAGVMLTVNGHVLADGLGYLPSQADHGNVVHQMLVNYQMNEMGGEAYLRLLEFLPGGETVQARSYSPYLDRYKTDPQNQFVFKLVRAGE
jgi:hypothetical protein